MSRCLNCRTPLVGSFCHACGQTAAPPRTARALARDLEVLALHSDSKLWRTLPLLLLWPGALTRRYVLGERVHFISPSLLFLFCVFLMFLAVNQVMAPGVARFDHQVVKSHVLLQEAAVTAHARQQQLMTERDQAIARGDSQTVMALDKRIRHVDRESTLLGSMAKSAGRAKASHQNGAAAIRQIAGAALATKALPAPIDRIIQAAQRDPSLALFKIKAASYKFSWLLIPLSAPLIGLLFWRRADVGLYDHAIFATHSLSFQMLMATALIVLDIVGVPARAVWIAAAIISPIHLYRHLRGAYQLRAVAAVWRTIALLAMTGIAVTIFFGLLFWIELR